MKTYPVKLTAAQIEAVNKLNISVYKIAKNSHMHAHRLRLALKGEREVSVSTALKLSNIIGLSLDEFEALV